MFSTLIAVSSHYINKADLRRASQLAEALQRGQDEGRQWWKPAIDCVLGMIAYLRGEYATARSFFHQVTEGFVEDNDSNMEELWLVPHDAVAMAFEHMAMHDILRGDIAAAESNFDAAMKRADELGFPMGPYNLVYALDMKLLMRCEAGQFDDARALASRLIEKSERYGFDFNSALGATEQALIDACDSLACGTTDLTVLSAQIENLTQMADLWRAVGLNAYQTQYDCAIAGLLTAAGRSEDAAARIEVALSLADDTEMHFYDAELLRARARTHTDPDASAADLGVAIQLARHQDAPLFELRSAIDDFELRGEDARSALADVVDRMPVDCTMPEVKRARALLG